jgi:tetratricopeptide (TPR) repeat protein
MGEANQRRWARLLQNERDNLRTAIEWALERRPAVAIEMIASQGFYWGQRGYAAEVLRWLEEGIEKVAEQPVAEGDGQIQREVTLAQAYWVKAVVIEALGEAAGAVSAIEESVRLWRKVGDLRGLSRSLSLLGAWGLFFGIPNPYRAYLEEGLAIARKIHFDEAIGTALIGLGVEKMWEGDYATAQTYLEDSLELMHKAGDERSANLGRVTLAQVALLQGDFQTARARFAESMTLLQDLGNTYFVNIARSGLADVLRLEKDFSQAVKTYLETLAEWQELGNHGAVARCLECLAFIAGELAQTETHASRQHDLLQRSGVLLGAAEALRKTSGSAMTPNERREYDEKLSSLQSLSPQEVFKAGWRQGQEMNIDQAKAIGEELWAKQ